MSPQDFAWLDHCRPHHEVKALPTQGDKAEVSCAARPVDRGEWAMLNDGRDH